MRSVKEAFCDGFALMLVAVVWALIVKLWLWVLP